MRRAIYESKADREYHDAIEAFDRQDFDAFLKNFFLAIHSRYDIEQPIVQRYIRRKLNIIKRQQQQISELENDLQQQKDMLKRLAAEYVLLGKECEAEHMSEAAIRNYEKALSLYPDAYEAERRIKKLKKKVSQTR